MKDIKFGNMLTVTNGIMVQGCNAQGAMNSGIAKDIRARYPKNFDIYYAYCKTHGPEKSLGSVVYFPINNQLMIANAITQLHYGRDNTIRYVDYEAIQSTFRFIVDAAVRTGKDVHYPQIGAGLANGDWDIISEIIDNEFDKFPQNIFGLPINRTLWIFKPDMNS